MHHINQLRPKGADENYKNALFNCGPAVVAMLARGHGKMKDMSDAELVSQLGSGIVTDKGSTSEGIAQMMERADIPVAGDALGAGYSDKDLQDQLKQGHKLIAQVRSTNPQAQKDSAHYVVVEGMTRDGNYVISDPLAKGPYAVRPDQLKEAVVKAPPDGGMLIPVGAPGEEIKAGPAAETTPAGTPAPAVAKPSDGFADPDMRALEARRVTDPTGLRVADIMRQAAVDPSMAAVAGRVSNPFGLPVAGLTNASRTGEIPLVANPLVGDAPVAGAVSQDAAVDAGYALPQHAFVGPRAAVEQPAVLPSTVAEPGTAKPADTTTAAPLIVDEKVALASEDKAFTVTDKELAAVDGTYTETSAKPTDERLVQNEQKNDYKIDISYSNKDEPAKKAETKQPVVDDKMSVGDFILNLLGLKKSGDKKAYDILDKLEHSKHSKDKHVLNYFKKSDKKDHGSGSRRDVEDFGG